MVSLKAVQESNAALETTASAKVALFVGATNGIGLATMTEYARHSKDSTVYIAGRSEAKLSKIIDDLKAISPNCSFFPIVSEISLFKNVDAVCDEVKSKEKSLDLLFMSAGYLKVSKQPDNADGLEETNSLRYYVRMRFVHNLLPLLDAAPSSRIVSILAGGKEGRLDEDDLELKHTFSMAKSAVQTATMTSIALREIAETHPTISCIHIYPGLVITTVYDTFCEGWYFPLPFLFRWTMLPLLKLFAVGIEESGARNLFHSTSARYPPAAARDPPGAGAALPEGIKVAQGADWKEGSGCYILNWDGETAGDKKLMDEYHERGMGKTIWQHTNNIFSRALGKT